jgi:hypothetical protein
LTGFGSARKSSVDSEISSSHHKSPNWFHVNIDLNLRKQLMQIQDISVANSSFQGSFVLLNAWNGWNEQRVLVPNDVDGYDALLNVKHIFKPNTTEAILHVGHRGGGTEKYVTDLIGLYPEYEHVYIGSHELNATFHHLQHRVRLIHLHSAMVGQHALAWSVLEVLDKLCPNAHPASSSTAGTHSCYLTVHDFQWLFPSNPNPNLEFLAKSVPEETNRLHCQKLFQVMDRIIYPTRFVRNYYLRILYAPEQLPPAWSGPQATSPTDGSNNLSILLRDMKQFAHGSASMMPITISTATTADQKARNTSHAVVGHSDRLVSHNYLHIPPLLVSPTNHTINVAYVGNFHRLKGSDAFLWLARHLSEVTYNQVTYQLQYHVFGRDMIAFDEPAVPCPSPPPATDCSPVTTPSNLIHHGEYQDEHLPELMKTYAIHVVTMLSIVPETWCYAASVILSNMGLPLIYFNHGSYLDRIPSAMHYSRQHHNPFPLSALELAAQLQEANLHPEDYDAFFTQQKLFKYFPIEMNATSGYQYEERKVLKTVVDAVSFVVDHANRTYGYLRQSKLVQPRKWYVLNYPKLVV